MIEETVVHLVHKVTCTIIKHLLNFIKNPLKCSCMFKQVSLVVWVCLVREVLLDHPVCKDSLVLLEQAEP